MSELTWGSAGIQLEKKKTFSSSLFYLWLLIHLALCYCHGTYLLEINTMLFCGKHLNNELRAPLKKTSPPNPSNKPNSKIMVNKRPGRQFKHLL